MKTQLHCKMQDNGASYVFGKTFTLQDCRDLFECDTPCTTCGAFEINGITRRLMGASQPRQKMAQSET